MRLRYDDDFVEGAVFLCAGGRRRGAPALQIRRFHSEREKCYSVADPDERNAAFFQVHFGWFREWGLEELITCSLREFPLLPDALQVLAFRQARGRNEEGAELYVGAGDVRTAVVALRLERLMRDDQMLRFLRHEFTHLHDMVDPVFAYSAQIALRVQNPTQRRIVRERYRLLWDVTIDGRLARHGREPMNHRDQHQALFNRAFSFWPEERRRLVFDAHWDVVSPRHENILALAADPRDLNHEREPLPGGSCPLCQFPTFEWADARRLTPETVAAASALFPGWTPEQSACKRCVEIYEVAGRFEAPSTMAW